jgi:cytochrome b561
MNWKNTSERYGALSIALHWLMLALIVAVYAAIDLTDLYPKGSAAREALKTWHFMLGLTVFALVLVRLAARWSGTAPEASASMPLWQKRSAALIHLALYALMVVMPLLGWLTLSAGGKPIPLFGIELPALIAQNKDLAGPLRKIHETLGTIGYFVIGVHALGALLHHYVMRDDTLVRMLPARRHV